MVEPPATTSGCGTTGFLTPHPLYWALGNTPFAREAAYAELVRAGIRREQQQALTDSALRAGRWAMRTLSRSLQTATERRW